MERVAPRTGDRNKVQGVSRICPRVLIVPVYHVTHHLSVYNQILTFGHHNNLSNTLTEIQHTCFRNLGLTWMAVEVGGGSGLMGQAGSSELTRTSRAYSFFRGKTSSHVERSLNRDLRVFSSTYKQSTGLGPQLQGSPRVSEHFKQKISPAGVFNICSQSRRRDRRSKTHNKQEGHYY